MIIFISAPYTVGDVAINIRKTCLVGDEILKKGHIPLIPHLSHLWHLISPKPYDTWLDIDLELLSMCDALLRLPGESKGADIEVEEAKKLCMIIYYSLEEIHTAPRKLSGSCK